MSTTAVLHAASSYARFTLGRSILDLFISAKIKLGLPIADDLEERRALYSEYTGPRLVAGLRIDGWSEHEMYDGYPGFASFTTTRSCKVQFPIAGRLSVIQSQISAARVRECWESECRDVELSIGVNAIALLDCCGRVAASGRIMKEEIAWDCVPELGNAEIQAAMQRVRDLHSEASFERGWDNFSTAEGLEDQARKLQDIIEINQTRPVLVI